MENNLGWFRKTSIALGLTSKPQASDVRSVELPITGSPYMPVNPVNLTTPYTDVVTTDRALGLAGVYRAVSFLATAASQLEIGVWRNNVEVPQPSTSLVVKPDYDQTLAAFIEQTVTSLAVTGNAYWLLNKSGPTADVKNISVLNPQAVHIEWRNGKKYFREGSDEFPAWKVKHLMLTRLPGFETGVGPIQACQNELRGAINLRNQADNYFTDAGIPSGLLSTDQPLTPELAAQYKAVWDSTNGQGIKVIGNGVKFQTTILSPADAQWLESQSFSITQIARMFGVPAIYMMTDPGNSSTYSNQEQVDTAFVKYTLMKYLNEIEGAFTDILPRGQLVKFKVDTLQRADVSTRFNAYKTAIDAGFLTVDEVRAKEGLPALGINAVPVNTQDSGDSTNEDGS